jgi:hypothetical protein
MTVWSVTVCAEHSPRHPAPRLNATLEPKEMTKEYKIMIGLAIFFTLFLIFKLIAFLIYTDAAPRLQH